MALEFILSFPFLPPRISVTFIISGLDFKTLTASGFSLFQSILFNYYNIIIAIFCSAPSVTVHLVERYLLELHLPLGPFAFCPSAALAVSPCCVQAFHCHMMEHPSSRPVPTSRPLTEKSLLSRLLWWWHCFESEHILQTVQVPIPESLMPARRKNGSVLHGSIDCCIPLEFTKAVVRFWPSS